MEMLNFIFQLGDMQNINYIIKLFILSIGSYYTAIKIVNIEEKNKLKIMINILFLAIIVIICGKLKSLMNSSYSIMGLTIMLTIMNYINIKREMGNAIVITIISLSINYVLFFLAVVVSFIPNILLNIRQVDLSLAVIAIVYIILLWKLLRVRRFKNGILVLQENAKNDYFNMAILNIGVIILFAVIILSEYKRGFTANLMFGVIIFSIIMFITIQKSLQLYYKQKILIKELEETKEEVCKKTKEIEELEAENIKISKKNHTLSHKQKSLEYKIEQMLSNTEISKEEVAEVQERLKAIQKEFYKEKATTELDKTEIPEIDDMLKYMQSECIKNKIDFELQIKGNIHHMTNNLITKEDLETLLADHIKNAIIAINHTDNVNRSILVRLGKIDGTYSMYIYDTGVEFEKETLENLGKKPSTTHLDEGGTGMGFMNTFDTLRKCKASLIIEEYNKPSRDNYTKAMIVKFDEKNEFKINSYREIIMNKS